MFVYYNPNPAGRIVGDCAVRAVAKALDIDWETSYNLICQAGFNMCEFIEVSYMNVNWKVRIKNKVFWLAIIPAVLVLIQKVLVVFGVSFDPTVLSGQLTDIIESVFLVLAIIGIVVDTTTKGLSDSDLAMTYTKLN